MYNYDVMHVCTCMCTCVSTLVCVNVCVYTYTGKYYTSVLLKQSAAKQFDYVEVRKVLEYVYYLLRIILFKVVCHWPDIICCLDDGLEA